MRKQTGSRNRGWLPAIGNRLSVAAGVALVAGMLAALAGSAQAATKTTASPGGYWTNTATWTGGSLPQAGDDVVIAHAVTLNQSTPLLASCSNTAAITFIGWNTALQATHVYVSNTITHNVQSQIAPADGVTAPQPLVNGGTYEQWVPDNRVWIICSNLTVAAGKTISVKGKGYAGNSGTGPGSGPGGGKSDTLNAGGGGYGGRGATKNAGIGGYTYGSVTNPVDPGSGGGYGGATFNPLNYGGGAVRIQASGTVTVDGTIDADGIFNNSRISGTESGNGSGGAIWITCATYQGNGLLRAKGVDTGCCGSGSSAGGGGRIAIEITDTTAQRLVSLSTTPRPIMMALVGVGGVSFDPGGAGTVYVNYPGALPGLFRDYSIPAGMLSWPYAIEWELGSLTVRDVTLNLPLTNYAIHVSNNLLLTNSANLYVYAGITNATWPTYSARIRVDGDMIVSPGCTNYVSLANQSDASTNGGPARFEVKNLTVHAGGVLTANGLGYAGGTSAHRYGYGTGPGLEGNQRGGGGGHGGAGGDGQTQAGLGGRTYGVSNAPVALGSGGGFGDGGIKGSAGGGAIWIRATGTVTANGTISANGLRQTDFGGAGSGGSVFIACKDLIGGTAGVKNITANGGSSSSKGGGGGGRVAVWYNISLDTLDGYLVTGAGGKNLTTNAPTGFSGALSAIGGVADATPTGNGADGTQSFYSIPPPKGTVIMMR